MENPSSSGIATTLSIWACTNAEDVPGNGFSTSSVFQTCSTNNTNSCTNVAIRQSSLSFSYQNMHVSFGTSTIVPRLSVSAGTTYYFMYGAESGATANSTGQVALIVEPSRFAPLQSATLFSSPEPEETNCSTNIADQANAFLYFTKREGDNVILVDTGATDFDTIGSFYLGNNSALASCPTNWLATIDLDANPIGVVITESYDALSVIISPYSGTGNDGWLVQVWAMSGPSFKQPSPSAEPSAPSAPATPSAPSGSPQEAPNSSPSSTPTTPPASTPSGAPSLAVGLGLFGFTLAMAFLG